MFECFTFGAQPQARCPQQDDTSASPIDVSCIPTPSRPISTEPPASSAMSDLLNKLDGQTLVPDRSEVSQSSMWNDTLASPAFTDAVEDGFQFTYISTRHGLTTYKASPSSGPSYSASPSSSSRPSHQPCRRLQRQLNTQLQTCTRHVKDITHLVEEMVSTNSQCNLHPAPSTSTSTSTPTFLPTSTEPSPPPVIAVDPELSTLTTPSTTTPSHILEADLDEGFSELDDLGALELLVQQQEQEQEQGFDGATSLRRAGAPGGIRKFGAGKYPFASGYKSYYGDQGAEREKGKVKCMPRMRKRK